MKVFHISSAPFSGGAARAGFRLHQGLQREQGIESQWIDTDVRVNGEGVLRLPSTQRKQPLLTRIRRRQWAKKVSNHFAGTSAPASNPIGWGTVEQLEKLPVPDLWNLHWVSWFMDWETMLPWMAERAPIVWTLHDLNPLKGIWHYEPHAEECTLHRIKLERTAIKRKREALSRIPKEQLVFVGPSTWIAECCRHSEVTQDFPVVNIPYGLDTLSFTPREPSLFKRMLNIPQESFVIGFLAANLRDTRKGMASFQVALGELATDFPQVHLITVGAGEIYGGGLKHTHLGSLESDHLLSSFYSACDLFVCPSLQDNLPNTVLESIACGTPVVGYNVGGIPDMIVENESGFLVTPVGSSNSLHAIIESRIQAGTSQALRQATRKLAVERFSASVQSGRYAELYRKLLSQ